VVFVFQGGAEESAQIGNEFVGGVGIAVDEGGDGVEGIEKKVGLELETQCVEARLVETGGQSEGLMIAVLSAAIVGERVSASHEDEIHREAEISAEGERI
jgi:hypothetical protein